jgi:hypothetical protein
MDAFVAAVMPHVPGVLIGLVIGGFYHWLATRSSTREIRDLREFVETGFREAHDSFESVAKRTGLKKKGSPPKYEIFTKDGKPKR